MRLVYSQEELQALSTALAGVLQKCRDGNLDHPNYGLCRNLDYSVGTRHLGYDFMGTALNLWPHSLRLRASGDGEDPEARGYPIPRNHTLGYYEGTNLAYCINAMEFAVKLCAAMLAAYDLGEHNEVHSGFR